MLKTLEQEIEQDVRSIENTNSYRVDAIAKAKARGLKLPKELRVTPNYTKTTRRQLPSDWRFLDDERVRWATALTQQPRNTQPTWRRLIRVREERIAGALAMLKIHRWLDEHRQLVTKEDAK